VRAGNGIVYTAEGGSAVGVHGDRIEVVVTGSVGSAALRRVAASLGVTGRLVPASWDEAATTTVDRLAARGLAGLVLAEHSGFAPPAVRVEGDTATLVFTGPGERAVTLVTQPGGALTPPLDPDAVGVAVRGHDGRWSPARGDLEWVEADQVWSLRTTTVALNELVSLANRMHSP
jgi:hypothetical protein